jgi:UDP-glucose:glycoprotein glucosyltransferase
MTMWLVADLDSAEGIRLVKDALRHLESDQCSSRLGFIHLRSIGTSGEPKVSWLTHQLVTVSALQNLKPKEILKLVESIENDLLDINDSKKLSNVIGQAGMDAIASDSDNGNRGFAYTVFVDAGLEIGRQLGLTVDQPHLLVNGRVSTGNRPNG